jgi:hypothetical protein
MICAGKNFGTCTMYVCMFRGGFPMHCDLYVVYNLHYNNLHYNTCRSFPRGFLLTLEHPSGSLPARLSSSEMPFLLLLLSCNLMLSQNCKMKVSFKREHSNRTSCIQQIMYYKNKKALCEGHAVRLYAY